MTPESAPPLRPRVKICGITDAHDARLSIDLGAELIGLNFYRPSPRYIDPARAAELVSSVESEQASRGRVKWVGVFVNEDIDRAARIAEQVGLDLLQLHGDETPEQIAPIASKSIKALRVRGDLTADLIDPWRSLGLWGLLIDAKHETLYGGSGERWNVESLPVALGLGGDSPDRHLRVWVAGGLEPSNIAAAAAHGPWGLDLCSGVESSPGRKDPALLTQLFAELSSSNRISFTPDEENHHGQTSTTA